MNPEITKLIEQYLAEELSESDKQVFEDRLATNQELQNEVAFHREIHEAAKRSALRNDVLKASKQFHWIQNLKWGGIGLGLAVLIGSSTWFAVNTLSDKDEIPLSKLNALTAELEANSPIDNMPSEFFSWKGQDTAMLSKDGILISIPANALLLNGKPYTEQAVIQWQEATDGASIVKAGLSTTSDGKLLETQGMFSFSATTTDGKQLTINPKVGIYVQVPVDEYREGMMLFDGQKDKDGMINWVKPRKLEKIPVPVSMDLLDFYPPGYEDKLNELKARREKKYRDSLYLSFEDKGSTSNMPAVEKEWRGKDLFNQKCAVCHMADKNTTGPKLRNVRSKWDKEGAKSGSIYSWVKDWQSAAKKDLYALEITRWSPVAHVDNPDLSNGQIDAIFDFIDGNKSDTPNKNSGNWQDKIQWSFSVEYLANNEANIIGKATLRDGWHIFSVDHDPYKADHTGIPTSFILPSMYDVQPRTQLKDGKKPLIKKDELGTTLCFENEAIFKQRVKLFAKSPIEYEFKYSFQICNRNGCIFPPDQKATVWFNGNAGSASAIASTSDSYIPPSAVLGFWNNKFNNTLLATREFEKRMRSIHGTCSKKILDIYLNNLDRPMHELDRKVAEIGHSEFFTFEDEMVGALNPNDPHVKGLQEFYQKAVEQLKQMERRSREKEQKRRRDWDNSVSSERSNEISRSAQRNAKVFVEEYNLNHKNVRKQLGRTLGARIYGTRPVSNIDKFVLETTQARKTGEFFDEETSKTARIQYNDFSFSVSGHEKFDQLYAYLFPDKLNSYHRLKGENGTFSFPLNDAIIYDLAIVGISEEGYSYVQRLTVKGGALGELSLDHVSESALDASIRQLNKKRGTGSLDVKDELSWLVKEQKNYVEIKRRKDEQLFREKVKKAVFPCLEADCGVVVMADSSVISSGNDGIFN